MGSKIVAWSAANTSENDISPQFDRVALLPTMRIAYKVKCRVPGWSCSIKLIHQIWAIWTQRVAGVVRVSLVGGLCGWVGRACICWEREGGGVINITMLTFCQYQSHGVHLSNWFLSCRKNPFSITSLSLYRKAAESFSKIISQPFSVAYIGQTRHHP